MSVCVERKPFLNRQRCTVTCEGTSTAATTTSKRHVNLEQLQTTGRDDLTNLSKRGGGGGGGGNTRKKKSVIDLSTKHTVPHRTNRTPVHGFDKTAGRAAEWGHETTRGTTPLENKTPPLMTPTPASFPPFLGKVALLWCSAGDTDTAVKLQRHASTRAATTNHCRENKKERKTPERERGRFSETGTIQKYGKTTTRRVS